MSGKTSDHERRIWRLRVSPPAGSQPPHHNLVCLTAALSQQNIVSNKQSLEQLTNLQLRTLIFLIEREIPTSPVFSKTPLRRASF
jgi:hypothetical protein